MSYHPNSKSYAQDIIGSNLIPVDVIATFSRSGGMKPLYIRYENPEKELITVTIEQILNENCSSSFVDYVCKVQIGESLKQINLCYHTGQLRWFVKKK